MSHQGIFSSEIEVFLEKKRPNMYMLYHISDSKNRQQQKQIGSMTRPKRIDFFIKRVILKFWSAKVFFRPPNSAPSLRLRLHIPTTSFICVISASACLIHSSTTASSAWCMGFLGQRVSRPTWSSTRFWARTFL